MKLKPKTSRRLMILGGTTLALVGGVTTLFLVRSAGKAREVVDARERGLRLVADGQYYPALGDLAKFLESPDHQNDREAMLAYAKARENVEEPDGSHIIQAITVYQKAWSLDNNDRATGLRLLDLYTTAGQFPEAREIARKLRPADLSKATDADFEVLRQEVNSRIGANATDAEIMPLLQRMTQLRPTDYPTQVVYVEYMRDRGAPGDAMRFVETLGQGDTADRKAQIALLSALARRDNPGFNGAEATFAALCELAGLDPMTAGPTREVTLTALETLRYASLFDSVGQFQHTLAVLSAGVKQTNDPVVLRVLARRSWMSGRPGDTMVYIPQVDLGPSGTPTEVLVYRVLSLIDLARIDEAKPIIAALGNREGDYRARAWKPVLEKLVLPTPLPPADAVPLFHEALKIAKGDVVLLTFQGENLQRLGRLSEAREAWEQACNSSLAVGWTRPWLNRANLALAQGKPITALDAAQNAVRIAPRSMATYATFFRAQTALIESGYQNAGDPGDLLSTAERVDRELALQPANDDIKSFRELTLPGRMLLTGLARGNDAARVLWESTVKELGTLNNETYAQVFQTSLRRNLGLNAPVLAAWEQAEGLTPRVALAKAFELKANNDDAGARALLSGKVGVAPGTSPQQRAEHLAWMQAWAQFLGASNDAKAKEAWVASADFAPENLDAQLAAVEAPSVSQDLAQVTRLLDRIATLSKFTPETLPPQLRLARARALLAEPLTNDNRRAAIDLLRQLIGQERDLVEAQIMLARALMIDRPEANIRPLRAEAIAAINALLPSVPDQDNWTLEQARLYRGEGDLTNAMSMFERISNSPSAPVGMKILAIEEMVNIREFDAAARALERVRTTLPAESVTPVNLKLAEVYKAQKRDRSSRDLYRSINPSELDRVEYCIALAEGLYGYGDADAAEKAMARIDQLQVTPATRQIARARYLARTQRGDEALAVLREATTKFPNEPETWTSLASLLVEQGKLDDARQSLVQARTALPTNESIATLDRQLSAAGQQGISANMPLAELAKVLDQNPATKERAEGVRALAASVEAKQLDSMDRIAELKARFRADPALLTLLARTLSTQTPPRMNLAADVITEAMERHPASIEAAVFGTNLFRAMNDWPQALRCAQAWQQLSDDPAADMIVAETKLIMNQPEGVAQMLESNVTLAKQSPQDPMSVRMMTLYGQALILNGKPDQASQELGPLLQLSNGLRTQFWLASAGSMVKPETKVREWIERVRPLMDGTSEDEQLALAGAFANAAARFPAVASEFRGEAMATLRKLTARAEASARAWEAYASLLQVEKQTDQAVAAFRRALEKDPKSIFALRGLAAAERDPALAVQLTKQVLDITGPGDALSQLQYGQALVLHGRTLDAKARSVNGATAAAALFNVIGAQPNNAQSRLFVIEALEAQGKVAETLEHYEVLLDSKDLAPGMRAPLRNNFAYAIVRSGRSGLDLDRAHALAEQATQEQPLSPFFDTLGAVERARGKRDLALAAYRKAVQLDEKAYSSWISLAEILKAGSPAEATEAGQIAQRLRQAGDAIPQDLRERLAKLAE